MREMATLVDVLNGNRFRMVDADDGYIYIETTAKHSGDVVVMTSVRVNRDTAMPALRAFVRT
jgi:hypothetical protein